MKTSDQERAGLLEELERLIELARTPLTWAQMPKVEKGLGRAVTRFKRVQHLKYREEDSR